MTLIFVFSKFHDVTATRVISKLKFYFFVKSRQKVSCTQAEKKTNILFKKNELSGHICPLKSKRTSIGSGTSNFSSLKLIFQEVQVEPRQCSCVFFVGFLQALQGGPPCVFSCWFFRGIIGGTPDKRIYEDLF